ncbi:putative amidohydrolase [Dinoroseobacter shibae DFL 12 = DSM 16493]|jgi:imidazolonepropionase-like amidohydrolase|uniref:Putative amidohydrolase n=1 Tax=Dinoroseobacter shibae (strain DSM 16493 / NCIMB 14021 / DFL 12) TaxID=398580 RepID=A8LRK0_DINSH|nr:amidohydrolase family protein [Dinoroseobacter shibae]ABV94031.1 putative amidohydrolase [Dinoroseobacter shibae DFL 12 = DSM 16493]URF45473.1 amidohydrolase family protein [Dinoroseobacter shibae]URF49778.1 amidohydrolase family protein [Dinoroseobacter shibae]
MKVQTTVLLGTAVSALVAVQALAQDIPSEVTLFKDVNIFDGKNDALLEGYDVLVVRNLIQQIAEDIPVSGTYELEVSTGALERVETLPGSGVNGYSITIRDADGVETQTQQVAVNVIAGGGRTLMPGLIDAHYHLMLAASQGDSWRLEQPDYTHATMVVEANNLLQRGFTSIRDTAGPGFGIKKAVDEGMIPGPRMYLSGTLITQTSGHADRTLPFEEPRIFSGRAPVGEEVMKLDRVVNGRDEVLAATRQNLKQGATQIKIAIGGGVYSLYDPLDVTEFTEDEIRAAVDAASDWGTYVTAHVYTPKGVLRGIRNGLKTIEHGQLMDEEAAREMAERGVYLITQPFEAEENLRALANDIQWAKYLQVVEGWQRTADLVKQYDIKMGFGTDLVFAPDTNGQQADFLARFGKWFSNIEMLRMITSTNAEILALSGPRNPYQEGPLGVIEEGAYADIILVDGNPLEDVSILGSNGANIPLVMKDGRIFKNTMN